MVVDPFFLCEITLYLDKLEVFLLHIWSLFLILEFDND